MAQIYDIAVVGGGAAGLMAAVSAARERPGTEIAVLEGNSRVGRKLLATGNGRCNLTNTGVSAAHYHGDAEAIQPILKTCTPGFIVDLFASMGLLCREREEGRVYPYSLQASAVLDALRLALAQAGAEEQCGFPVESLRKEGADFLLSGGGRTVRAKRVVAASGGLAYPQLGANGEGLRVLQTLGHSVTRPFPALVQVTTEPRRARPLKGARSPARAVLYADGVPVKSASGEVQFTERGLSGICIFELSRLVGELTGKHRLEIALDLIPEYPAEAVAAFLRQRCRACPGLPVRELLNGMIHKQLGPEVVAAALPRPPKTIGSLDAGRLSAAAAMVGHFAFPVTGTLSWRDAQVTAGGVPLRETDGNLQSVFCPGLYLAGELLNIDGDCGGFNLHWAWSSGFWAGRAAARSLG